MMREEYEQFLTCQEIEPPPKLSEQILSKIHLDLNTQSRHRIPKSFFICLLIVIIGLSLGLALRKCHSKASYTPDRNKSYPLRHLSLL